uniref:(California timema) hypothetical protein n=1 Tax=Timema californicum TaxID=61474 RepID=A0A7R9IZP3_TIMCA|nr:unnamed protein product [Timema californicum]
MIHVLLDSLVERGCSCLDVIFAGRRLWNIILSFPATSNYYDCYCYTSLGYSLQQDCSSPRTSQYLKNNRVDLKGRVGRRNRVPDTDLRDQGSISTQYKGPVFLVVGRQTSECVGLGESMKDAVILQKQTYLLTSIVIPAQQGPMVCLDINSHGLDVSGYDLHTVAGLSSSANIT